LFVAKATWIDSKPYHYTRVYRR